MTIAEFSHRIGPNARSISAAPILNGTRNRHGICAGSLFPLVKARGQKGTDVCAPRFPLCTFCFVLCAAYRFGKRVRTTAGSGTVKRSPRPNPAGLAALARAEPQNTATGVPSACASSLRYACPNW